MPVKVPARRWTRPRLDPLALAPVPPPPPKDEVEFIDVDQRSEEWHALRSGIPTASRFADIMAGGDGKGRTGYLRQLAGEILSGEPAEMFQTKAMQRGIEMEPEIRDWYERTKFADLKQIGFVKRTVRRSFARDFVIGCSPDSQVGERRGLEIKTEKPELLVARLESGARGFPSEHRAQLQGTMLVCDWEEMDLVIGYGRMPKAEFTLMRDDVYIARLLDELERFSYDLEQLVAKIKKMGR